jgi:biotin synthase
MPAIEAASSHDPIESLRQGDAVHRNPGALRHDWTRAEVEALFELPFTELLHRAATVHRQHFDPAEVQVSTLLSVKTGGCPEDCAYCPQAQRYHTGVEAQKLMSTETVLEKARQAKAAGASRFCMGAAWRSPKDRDIPKVAAMIREVKALGLETCATLGMLSQEQAGALKDAGLDYYNHNIDTDPEYYGSIIHTREMQDRLDTLSHVRDAGMKTCCGGIVGMGESRRQRAGLLQTLATLPAHPDSVPINRLVQVEGTPLHGTVELDPFEFVRTIAIARILMPKSMVRLSAGRETMSDELQALCFAAGANSIFYGEKLLTTGNPDTERDLALFARLGLRPMQVTVDADGHDHAGTVHAEILELEILEPNSVEPNSLEPKARPHAA